VIRQLAAIARIIDKPLGEHAPLEPLLEELALLPELFEAVMTFEGLPHDQRFILRHARGCPRVLARSWAEWPMHRLFSALQPRRIAHPISGRHALAIPLEVGSKRYVVVASLSDVLTDECEAMLETLEHVTTPRAASTPLPSAEIPITPIEPRIVSFGMCANLEGRVDALVRQRGWRLRAETKFRAFRDALRANAPPDLVLIDAPALPNLLRWLRAVYDNGFGTEPKVLAFGGNEATSLRDQTLVDDAVPHDAPREVIFSAIKRLVRDVPRLRRARMAKANAVTDTELSAAETAEELAAIAASHAAEIMHGWAGVFLVTPEGATFAAERPALLKWAMRRLPRAFLNDRPSFEIFGGRAFFDDAFGPAFDTRELAALAPVSTACIPLIRGENRLGVLVAVSHHGAADSSMFEALEQFAGTLAHRFETFTYNAVAQLPVQHNGVWKCTHSGVFEIALYRSQRCKVPFRYRMLDDARGVLTIGADIDAGRNKGIVASLETVTGAISYAVRGFPPPLLLDVAGPGGVLTMRRHVTYGSTNLEPPAALFMYDRMLSSWLRASERDMSSLTESIEDQRPTGLAVVVTTGSRRL
jgi:hypothetical protein